MSHVAGPIGPLDGVPAEADVIGLPGGLDGAIPEHYRSIDSAPLEFSVTRGARVTGGFIVVFVVLSVSVLTLSARRDVLSPYRDLVFDSVRGEVAVVPLRMFVIAFFLTYGMFVRANWFRRLVLVGAMLAKFLAVCILIDVGSTELSVRTSLDVGLAAQEVLSLGAALAIFPHTVLRQASLPRAAPLDGAPRLSRAAVVRFAIAVPVAVMLAALIEREFLGPVNMLRSWALIGGVGPGVFLAQQAFVMILAAHGWRALRRSRQADFAPDLAIVVPAHNEAHGISATIGAVDRAAHGYPGRVHIHIIDNCSEDATTSVASDALTECAVVSGDVSFCGVPGKAAALNQGFSKVREDFIVRIDADTVIGDGCLDTAMRHFADPQVGAVGGLPLPLHNSTLIEKVRLVEVILKHGLFQTCQEGFDGILGVPGMFTAYRRSAVEAVDGTAEGMNGEDTDICLRMSAAGYRTLSDPHAVYYSETPAMYSHLAEQRTRWFRSIYHVAAHNRGILLRRRTMAGGVVLPFMLMSATRRAMLVPLLLYCGLALSAYHPALDQIRWQPVAAVVVGMPLLMAIFACHVLRRLYAMKYLPHYLLFRLLRSYLTIGATLTLVYPPLSWKYRPRHSPVRGSDRAGSHPDPVEEGIRPSGQRHGQLG